jgi:S1-C subfamily serine protease
VVVGGRLLFRTLRDTAQQSFGRFQAENNQPSAFLGTSGFSDVEEEGAPPPLKGMPPPPEGAPPPPEGAPPPPGGKQTGGVLIEGTLPDSPAERAGLIDGDIITKFDGMVVNGEDAMRETLRATPIGKTVEIVFVRDGETKTTQLTTISGKDYDYDERMPKEKGVLGIDDTTRVAVEGTKIHGVRLNEVYANRPADLAGLKEGDIVVEFDKKPVRTNEGFEIYISRAKPASTVDVVVYRDGQRVTIPVKMGRRT